MEAVDLCDGAAEGLWCDSRTLSPVFLLRVHGLSFSS